MKMSTGQFDELALGNFGLAKNNKSIALFYMTFIKIDRLITTNQNKIA